MANITRTRWIYPLLVWAIFIAYELGSAYVILGKTGSGWVLGSHYVLYISLFYTNALIVLPKAIHHQKHRVFWVPVYIIIEIIVFLIINCLLNGVLEGFGLEPTIIGDSTLLHSIALGLWRISYFLALSIAYWFWLRGVSIEHRMQTVTNQRLIDQKKHVDLEKNVLQLQNAYMHSQLNPHLYFNTLNFVYNSVYKASPKAGEAVMLLSDLSRYALSQVDVNGRVELCKEVENISNIIKINQIRYDGELNIKFESQKSDTKLWIIPLVLVSFVENVFKYGELQDPDKPAFIKTELKNDSFFLKAAIIKGTGPILNVQSLVLLTRVPACKMHTETILI